MIHEYWKVQTSALFKDDLLPRTYNKRVYFIPSLLSFSESKKFNSSLSSFLSKLEEMREWCLI